MKPLTVAIAGAGKLGQTHARHWSSVEGVRVIGVADSSYVRAASLAAEAARDTAVDAYADLPSLLANLTPDIVDICTPTPSHRELIEIAAIAGRAVFVEKPLARTLADCDAIVQCVETHKISLMVGHVVRWFPAYARAKAIVDTGQLGEAVTVRASRTAGFPTRGVWYADPEQSGGVVLDAMLHDFDWLRWCCGPVMSVYANGLTWLPEHQGKRDYALVTLRFQSGAIGHVTGSWAHAGPMRTTFELCGTGGMIDFDSEASAPLDLLTPERRQAESPLFAGEDPFLCELQAFAASLRAGTPPPISATEGREAVRIALAALESMRTGQKVSL